MAEESIAVSASRAAQTRWRVARTALVLIVVSSMVFFALGYHVGSDRVAATPSALAPPSARANFDRCIEREAYCEREKMNYAADYFACQRALGETRRDQ